MDSQNSYFANIPVNHNLMTLVRWLKTFIIGHDFYYYTDGFQTTLVFGSKVNPTKSTVFFLFFIYTA